MKISVIIPAYNAEKFIIKAIKSVKNQTFQPYEIILVDDGSSDATIKIVEDNFPEVRIISQVNQGPSAARNAGILEAEGDWIAFLDSDDEYKQTLFENYNDVFLRKNDLVWICSPYIINRGDNMRKIKYSGKQLKSTYIENIFLASKDFNAAVFAEIISTCGVLIKRKIFDEIGMFDTNFSFGEDIDLWFRISLKYPEIGYTKDYGFKYNYINVDSLTRLEQNPKNLMNRINRINSSWKYTELVEDHTIKSNAQLILNVWCYRLFKSMIKSLNFQYFRCFSSNVVYSLDFKNKLAFRIIQLIAFIVPVENE
jgi:glycosyltransferase involved in cell wall biosynthesis